MPLISPDIKRRVVWLIVVIGALIGLSLTERLASNPILGAAYNFSRNHLFGPQVEKPVLIVNLTQDARKPYNGRHYDRHRLASLLTKILKAGPRCCVLDIDLSDAETPEESAPLVAALKTASKGVVLLPLDAVEETRGDANPFPKPLFDAYSAFQSEAYPAWFRAKDGNVRDFEPLIKFGTTDNQHLCAAMLDPSDQRGITGGDVPIDYRIANAYRVVEENGVDTGWLTDLKSDVVIIGDLDESGFTSAEDMHPAPLPWGRQYGQVPGAVLLAYGYETLKLGNSLHELGGKSAALLCFALFLGCFLRTPLWHMSNKRSTLSKGLDSEENGERDQVQLGRYRAVTVLIVLLYLAAFCVMAVEGVVLPLAWAITLTFMGSDLGELFFDYFRKAPKKMKRKKPSVPS